MRRAACLAVCKQPSATQRRVFIAGTYHKTRHYLTRLIELLALCDRCSLASEFKCCLRKSPTRATGRRSHDATIQASGRRSRGCGRTLTNAPSFTQLCADQPSKMRYPSYWFPRSEVHLPPIFADQPIKNVIPLNACLTRPADFSRPRVAKSRRKRWKGKTVIVTTRLSQFYVSTFMYQFFKRRPQTRERERWPFVRVFMWVFPVEEILHEPARLGTFGQATARG